MKRFDVRLLAALTVALACVSVPAEAQLRFTGAYRSFTLEACLDGKCVGPGTVSSTELGAFDRVLEVAIGGPSGSVLAQAQHRSSIPTSSGNQVTGFGYGYHATEATSPPVVRAGAAFDAYFTADCTAEYSLMGAISPPSYLLPMTMSSFLFRDETAGLDLLSLTSGWVDGGVFRTGLLFAGHEYRIQAMAKTGWRDFPTPVRILADCGWGFTLTATPLPAPEPASLSVLGLGALAFLLRRRDPSA